MAARRSRTSTISQRPLRAYVDISVFGGVHDDEFRVVPAASHVDALHVALASVARADVVISWNFKHIVQLRRIHAFHAVNLVHGYPLIEIRSPLEVTDARA